MQCQNCDVLFEHKLNLSPDLNINILSKKYQLVPHNNQFTVVMKLNLIVFSVISLVLEI